MFGMMQTLGGAFDKQEAKNMEALKTLIESNTTDYFPEPVDEEENIKLGTEAGYQ